MTAPSTWFKFRPSRVLDLVATPAAPTDTSVIIPVRDNRAGLMELLASLQGLSRAPREVIVVDNLSAPPVDDSVIQGRAVLKTCAVPGPAAARNLGAGAATGQWLWFLDSDCLVEPQTLDNFCATQTTAVAIAGRIRSAGRGLLARYYEEQEILLPQFADCDEPLYLVTASAMVWRPAFLAVGAFDERFPTAAAEDIDLGLRLFQRGRLAFNRDAVVHHRFERSLASFRSRFRRYGAGTRALAEKYGVSLAPSPFEANRPTLLAQTLARVQYEALHSGYERTEDVVPSKHTPPPRA